MSFISSRQALKKYVQSNYDVKTSNFDSLFNTALRKAVASGDFLQPKGPSGPVKLAKRKNQLLLRFLNQLLKKVKLLLNQKQRKLKNPKRLKRLKRPKRKLLLQKTKAATKAKSTTTKAKAGKVTKPAKKAATTKKAAAKKTLLLKNRLNVGI